MTHPLSNPRSSDLNPEENRILLIEAYAGIRKMIRLTCRWVGITVVECPTLTAAVPSMLHEPVDCVAMDDIMFGRLVNDRPDLYKRARERGISFCIYTVDREPHPSVPKKHCQECLIFHPSSPEEITNSMSSLLRSRNQPRS